MNLPHCTVTHQASLVQPQIAQVTVQQGRMEAMFFYRLAYAVGFRPWDTGIPPPELREVIEGETALPAGRALDLGCGTGTSSVYMAQHGWEVTGIDMVPRALAMARGRAKTADVSPRLIEGDVTRLTELAIGDSYGLFLDLGCYHSIPEGRRPAYAEEVTRVAAPNATFLLFGFEPMGRRIGPRGMTADEIRQRFLGWDLLTVTPGSAPAASAWYQLRRRQG